MEPISRRGSTEGSYTHAGDPDGDNIMTRSSEHVIVSALVVGMVIDSAIATTAGIVYEFTINKAMRTRYQNY